MGPEEFRRMIVGDDVSAPYVIRTKGGRSYKVNDRAYAYIAPSYPNSVALFLPERGIIMLGLDSIESIQHEHEALAGR